ncbi:MAG: hypothetical protein IKC10_04375 [Alphaproteobacteria bacterium]|nr:hypothetical protein [Alphaproteobacteria bacterium]MBR3917962.1 hypothetical protein [Clostridia bacterium]
MDDYKIGELSMYGKKVLRRCKCWRCKFRGEYQWETTKKIFCNKTKRWGSLDRAQFCRYFESNSNSYTDFSTEE